MEPEDFMEALLWGAPFFLIALVFYGLSANKKRVGNKLQLQAQAELEAGRSTRARDKFLQALWKANEEPALERQILRSLQALPIEAKVPLAFADYELLIGQYEQLAKKSSHKALSELKQVQALKLELIQRVPESSELGR